MKEVVSKIVSSFIRYISFLKKICYRESLLIALGIAFTLLIFSKSSCDEFKQMIFSFLSSIIAGIISGILVSEDSLTHKK